MCEISLLLWLSNINAQSQKSLTSETEIFLTSYHVTLNRRSSFLYDQKLWLQMQMQMHLRLVLTPCFLSSSFKGAKLHFFPNMQLYHLQKEEAILTSCVSEAVAPRRDQTSQGELWGATRRPSKTWETGKTSGWVCSGGKADLMFSLSGGLINNLCCAIKRWGWAWSIGSRV